MTQKKLHKLYSLFSVNRPDINNDERCYLLVQRFEQCSFDQSTPYCQN